MKKLILVLSLSMLAITACNSENIAVNSIESLKTPEMENFDKAMKSLGDPANRPTEEERRSGTAELSDRRKKILLPSSIDLIKSTGVTEAEINQKTKGDVSAILVWAIQINQEKNAKIRTDVKLQN